VLDKKDVEAIARSRAGRGKATLWVLAIGLLWLLGTIVSLIVMFFNQSGLKDLTQWMMICIAIFALWYGFYILYVEIMARKAINKVREEFSGLIKGS